MGKTKPKNWALGRWLIESMDQWDRDYIDEEARGYIEGNSGFWVDEARRKTGAPPQTPGFFEVWQGK